MEKLKKEEMGNVLVTEEKSKLLTNRMRYPSLSLHVIFGGAAEGATIIPHEATREAWKA